MNSLRLFFFCLLMLVAGYVAFGLLVGYAKRRLLWLVPLLVSPVAMTVIRYTMEGGEPGGILDPRTQSWAMLFGDTVFIALALLAANYAMPGDPEQLEKINSRKWYWISYGSGYALAAFWNLVLDAPNYIKAGHEDLLYSPSHLWHGWVVFPVLAGALINYGIPVIFKWWRSWYALLFFLALAGYIAMSVADGTIHRLDVTNLHPPVSQTWLAG